MEFEYDPLKASENARKHGVTFEEAMTAFADPRSITIDDPLHSGPREERYVLIGRSLRLRVLVVVHTDREDRIRIISARKANAHEKKTYDQSH